MLPTNKRRELAAIPAKGQRLKRRQWASKEKLMIVLEGLKGESQKRILKTIFGDVILELKNAFYNAPFSIER